MSGLTIDASKRECAVFKIHYEIQSYLRPLAASEAERRPTLSRVFLVSHRSMACSAPTNHQYRTWISKIGIYAGAVALISVITGCGTIPDAQVSYYKAKSKVTVKVTRSVACDAKNSPLVANTVVPSVIHSADTSQAQTFRLSGLRGTFTDTDAKFEFFEDGRLKAVNATLTGQGEAVLKAATTLASTLVAFDATKSPSTYEGECAFVKDIGGGKPLTLAYEGDVNLTKSEPQSIPPDAAAAAYASRLTALLGGICVTVKSKELPAQPIQYNVGDGDLVLAARQPAWITINVGTSTVGNGCSGSLWEGKVLAAQLGTDYVVPVPRAAMFGKQGFGVAFQESGALGSIQYVSNSGAASALGAANSLVTIAEGETTAAKAASIKAEADVIVQQQRLIVCVADPKSCK